MSKNRFWWNGLNNMWKKELIENLLESKKYHNQKLTKVAILQFAEESDDILDDIVNLQRIHVSQSLSDNLNPLNFLDHIAEFQIVPDIYEDDLQAIDINCYPKHLRDKVRYIEIKNTNQGEDLTVLNDFFNLEYLVYVNCNLQSLEGIQKLTKLKRVDLSNNPFSDLAPLKNLPIQKLNVSNTNVTDATPLVNHKHIEWINVSELDLDVVQNCQLQSIENLELIVFTEETQVIVLENKTNHDIKLAKDRSWWKSLPFKWRIKLMSNLLDTEEYKDFGLDISGLHDLLNHSDQHQSAIMNLEKVKLPADILFDLNPLNKLQKLKDIVIVFDKNEDYCNAKFLRNFPVQYNSIVKAIMLNGVHIANDFEPFVNFNNLERLYIEDCGFTSLKGLKKLKNLTHLGGGSGNFFTDLKPLYDLNLEVLDLQDCPVDDISFIENIPTLEWLNLRSISYVRSYLPLFELPFLKLAICFKPVEISETSLRKQFDFEISANQDYLSCIFNLNPKVIPRKLISKSSMHKN